MPLAPREDLIRELPYARRYARALTASQAGGDTLVGDALRHLLTEAAASATLPEGARWQLYRAITQTFDRTGPLTHDGLSPPQRQLLLLTALEGLSLESAANVLEIDPEEAAGLLSRARAHVRAAAATDVLIIEDEPIIAMDIEDLVQNCGHRVLGLACSEREALEIAQKSKPGLILADINLGSGGDGTRAVAAILKIHQVPVIFVTAYPERLLTGDAVEPAFVITKPFEPLTLAIATYQAVSASHKREQFALAPD